MGRLLCLAALLLAARSAGADEAAAAAVAAARAAAAAAADAADEIKAAGPLYASYDAVTEFATLAEFDAAVMSDERAWVVTVYMGEGCPACVQMVEDFAKIADELDASWGVKFAAVNASPKTEGAKMAKRLNVMAAPSVLAITGPSSQNPYTGKPYRETVPFALDLQSDGPELFKPRDLKRWISNALPKPVRVEKVNELTKPPYAFIATERSTSSPLAKSYALSMRGLMPLLEVVYKEQEGSPILTKAGISPDQKLPMLVGVTDLLENPQIFEGDLADRSKVLEWLGAIAATKKEEEVEEAVSNLDVIPGASFNEEVVKSVMATILVPSGKELGTAAEKKIKDVRGVIKAASVDCTESTLKVCDKLKEGQFVVYNHGAGSRRSTDHGDAMSAFEAAAASVSSEHVELVGAGVDVDNLMSRALRPPDEQSGPGIGIFIFSNREDVALGVRAAAHILKQIGVSVVQYTITGDASDAELMQRFSIRKAPAMVAIHETPAPEEAAQGGFGVGLAPYDRLMFGPPNLAGIISWCLMLLDQLSPDHAAVLREQVSTPGTSAKPPPASSTSSSFKAGEVVRIDTRELWEEACGESSKYALCAIAILDEHGRPSYDEELAIIRRVAKSEGDNNVFAFGYVDGACQSELSLSLDVNPETSVPTLVALSPKKKRLATFVGSYGESELKSFLRGVVSGRVGTRPLLQLEHITQRDCAEAAAKAKAASAEDPMVEEEEFDFMAEILAEEAAAKAALDKEAEAASKALKAEAEAKKKEKAEADSKPKPKKRKRKPKKAEL